MLYLDEKRDISVSDFEKILYELNLYDRYLKSNTITIKVNLTSGSYIESDSHAITCMKFLRGLIISILELDPVKKIYIAESDDSNYGYAFLKFEHLKIPEILELNEEQLKRVHILDLSRDRLIRIPNANLKYFLNRRQLWLSQTLVESDFIITLANLKTHNQTGFTGACKNLFGVLPDSNKWTYHPWIHSVIHDTVIAVQPALSIVDGFYAMEGNGPVTGEPVDLGFRLWSDCPVEADIKACNMVGIQTRGIKYLQLLCSTLKLDYLKSNNYKGIKKQIKKRKMSLIITMNIGLSIQSLGTHMQLFGHRIKSCNSIMKLVKVILFTNCTYKYKINVKSEKQLHL